MRSRSEAPQQDGTARAMERVLVSERDAAQGIAQARTQAQALLDAARDDALEIVNRAARRIARWQQAHGSAMAGRLDALRAQADAAAHANQRPDGAAIDRAAARLAARMTGVDDEPPH
jgi:vacuolar-type H+-ATPase subunit H